MDTSEEPTGRQPTGTVYWVTSSLSREFSKKTGQVNLHFFNDTDRALMDCVAEADIESNMSLIFWLITLRNALQTNPIDRIESQKLASIPLDLTKLSDWHLRTFRRIDVRLRCSGEVVTLEKIEPGSITPD